MSFEVNEAGSSPTGFFQFVMYASFAESLPLVVARVEENWGASCQNHRQKIKKEIHSFTRFSISHCPSLGGFVALTDLHPENLQIGFDVEEISRVDETVAKRVAHAKDHIPSSPDCYAPALMWSAREAAFKALQGPEQPQVVSQIQLYDWHNPQGNIWSFSFRSSGCEPGQGYAWDDGNHQFALCFWTPLRTDRVSE